MNDRIKQLRLELGLSQEEFGNRLGVGRGAITNIELNKVKPKPLFVSLVCKTYGVREIWLRTGEGPMYTEKIDDDELATIWAQIKTSDDDLMKAIIKSYWRLSESNKAAVREMVDKMLAE